MCVRLLVLGVVGVEGFPALRGGFVSVRTPMGVRWRDGVQERCELS